jgi:GNAT superfamily N-acetyltransferase
MSNFSISTDKSKLDIGMIHHFLSTEAYWSKNIPLCTVEAAIANSLNFGVYAGGRQAGYARIVSDFATIAYLGDVFILPQFRGKGLSKLLMREVTQHPKLQGLRRWILLTGDAHGLYRQFGFMAIASPNNWMEKHCKDVYQPAIS